jgi:hypothetical protein
MQGTSEFFQQLFPISPEPKALAAFLGAANLTAVDRLFDGIRRLSVLTEVADTFTQRSPRQVRDQIDAFIATYNRNAHPFEWTKQIVFAQHPRSSYANLRR